MTLRDVQQYPDAEQMSSETTTSAFLALIFKSMATSYTRCRSLRHRATAEFADRYHSAAILSDIGYVSS